MAHTDHDSTTDGTAGTDRDGDEHLSTAGDPGRAPDPNSGPDPDRVRTLDGAAVGGLSGGRGRERDDGSGRPLVSVVVVARNEEDRIADCLESVFRVCESVGEFEVILVDSNSSDRTVDIATEYPATVLRITDDDLCSCGAGRHVGMQAVDGEYVLFVDGDMVLEDDWLETAIGAIERQDDVAGVDGWLSDRTGGSGPVDYLRGVAVYEVAAIDDIGGFDPRITGLSDVDAGLRLRDSGYRLLRLPVEVASHPSSDGVGEALRRWEQGYYLSNGQVLRKFSTSPRLLSHWLYRFRFHLSVTGWLALGGYLLATGRRRALAGWVTVASGGVASLVALRGLRWTATKLSVRWALFTLGLLVGFRRGPTPSEYPLDRVEIVDRPADDPRRADRE